MTTRTPRETVEEFIRAYHAHDAAANHATIAPSFVRYGFTTEWGPMGVGSYKGKFEPFLVAFPDFAWKVTNLVLAGDWLAGGLITEYRFVEDASFMTQLGSDATNIVPET